MISLKAQFTAGQLDEQIQADIDKATMRTLIKVAERAIDIARQRAAAEKVYDNHTGNLESSTGFIILKNGKVIYKDFKSAEVGTDKSTGLRKGLASALSVLRDSRGWGIMLVSGMEYASWVEAKGFDVLTGGMRNFEQYLERAFNEIIIN